MQSIKYQTTVYKPINKLPRLILYMLRRGLIPLAIGFAVFAFVYTGAIELVNRILIEETGQNLFNPVAFSMLTAFTSFSIFNGGLRHGEYVVLGASRRRELILAYVFGVIYSLVIALATVAYAYAAQKIFSLNTELLSINLEYKTASYFEHSSVAFLICLAAFSLTRVVANVGGKFAKPISVALIVGFFIGLIVFLWIYSGLLADEKVQGGLFAIFTWRYMLPFGFALLALGVGLDIIKTMFEFFR